MTYCKRFFLLAIAMLALIVVAGCGQDKPKTCADQSVLAWAQIYAWGNTDNLAATGLTQSQVDKIREEVMAQTERALEPYQLTDASKAEIANYFFDDRKMNMKISTKLKKDDANNPVVELSATPMEAKAMEAAGKDADNAAAFQAIQQYLNEAKAQGLDPKTDTTYQDAVVKIMKGYFDQIPYGDSQTIDIPCKLAKTDDGKEMVWAPEDPTQIATLLLTAK